METNTYYYAGIDIGSTTVKLVLLNEAGEMVWGEYRRHCAHTQETLAEMMREARKKLGACRVKVRMTGSGAISLAEALRVGFVQEVVAVAEALHSRFLRLCGAAVAKVDFARNIFLISEVREDQS